MILELENLLLAALQAAITGPGVLVEAYPDKVDNYVLKGTAAVLVHYAGAEFTPPDGSEYVRQMLGASFQVVTVSRDLRTHTGAYALMDTIRDHVLGLEYRNKQFFAVSEQLLARENGVWWYGQTFAVQQRAKQA